MEIQDSKLVVCSKYGHREKMLGLHSFDDLTAIQVPAVRFEA